MKTRLFLLTVLGLTTVPALAQGPTPRRAPAPGTQPSPAAPTPVAPVVQPAPAAPPAPVVQPAPAVVPVVQPAPVAPVAPSAVQPAPVAPVAPSAVQPAPVAPGASPAAEPTDPKLLEWDEPGTPTSQLPAPYVTPHGTSIRLLPPRLRPVEPPPEPEPRIRGDATEHVALGIGGSLLWHQEHGYGISEPKQTSAFEVFASYDVWTPVPAFTLAAGVSLRNEVRSIDYDYDLKQNTVQAELLGRLRVTPWLDPHLRVAVGGVITRFSRVDEAANVTYEDRAGGVASTFGAGLTLHTPVRLFETRRGHLSALSLGVLVEGGYTLLADAELAAKPTRDGEVTRATFSFGSLDRSAAYLRIAGVLRF